MSNLVETLLDKLMFPSLSGRESSSPKKMSGSLNLAGNNPKMDSVLVSEFHQVLNSVSYAPNFPTMNGFIGMKNVPYSDASNCLVSRMSKLFIPSLVPLQDLYVLSTQDLLSPEPNFTQRSSILGEIIDQIDLFINKGYNIEQPHKSEDMPCDSVQTEVPLAPSFDPPEQKAPIKDPIPKDTVQGVIKSKICMTIQNSQKLNQELVNRKAKELHKRSKKRRKRQKKSGAQTPPEGERSNLEQGSVKSIDTSQGLISSPAGNSSDIFCDIISMSGQILPDVTSFVISVESVVDDDADWDVCSDSDWVSDCADFEVTGLFVGNLAAPIVSNCPVKIQSCLTVPCSHEDKERLRLKNVNKTWEDAYKDLDNHLKPPTMVSFAPERDLIQVHEVENYERKGEWELYALGRIRFKKRVCELESVISPCLMKEHREKVFKQLQHYCL